MKKILVKNDVFSHELELIKSERIRNFAKKALDELPDYFYEVAASSTGKYHPSYALGDGGLVRHTKAAVRIAASLLGLEMYKYTDDESDIMLAALLCHDGTKHGVPMQAYTVATHPVDVVNYLNTKPEIFAEITPDEKALFENCIKSHMGQWNTDRYKKEILPKPMTKYEKFVHQCDYLASRKFLEFVFDEGERTYTPIQADKNQDTEVDELQKLINEIIDNCKAAVAAGAPKNEVYDIIGAENGGQINPRTITSIDIANAVLQKLSAKRGEIDGK